MAGTLDEIEPEIFVRHYNTLTKIAKDFQERPSDLEGEVRNLWYYGETGAGKTRAALAEFPDCYRKISNNKWWDGYQDEDHVLMDDFDKKHEYMGYNLKIWGDRYAFIAETKGSSRMIRPKKIIVTSNYHPKDIWSDDTTLGPILRRFKVVRFMTLAESRASGDALPEDTRLHCTVEQEQLQAMLDEVPPPTSPLPLGDDWVLDTI